MRISPPRRRWPLAHPDWPWKGDVVLVAACSCFVPLLSTQLASTYLAVAPGASLWIGCTLIIAGSRTSWISVSDRIAPG